MYAFSRRMAGWIGVGFVALFVGVIGISRMMSGVARQPVAPVIRDVQSATSSAKAVSGPKLAFTFKDVAIAPLADERAGTYTFYIRNQFIGIRELQPEGVNAKKGFSAWVDGLHGAIRIGANTVPITRITAAGHDAIAFQTTEGDAHAENIVTDVGGHILLLQSQTTRGVLEEFLEKIDTVQKETK